MENLKSLLENSLYKKDMISFEKALNKMRYQINQEIKNKIITNEYLTMRYIRFMLRGNIVSLFGFNMPVYDIYNVIHRDVIKYQNKDEGKRVLLNAYRYSKLIRNTFKDELGLYLVDDIKKWWERKNGDN